MAQSDSIHDILTRNNKPHVHVTMGKQDGGLPATELPFVLGVLGDFRGDSEKPVKPLEERRFAQVSRDDFGKFMAGVAPAVTARVPNVLTETTDPQTELQVKLQFSSMEDFQPARILQQVPALERLLAARKLLKQLGNVMERSKGGESILEAIMQSPDKLQSLKEEVSKRQAETTDE